MAKSSVTFQDIAQYTGFSKTTISRYFNHPDTVTPQNQAIIREALEKLGYQSNKVARILAKGQTEFIGLIIPNLYLSFYAEILDEFLKSYEKYGYKFLVFSGGQGEEAERQYIQELLAYHVEGLIVLSHTIPSLELASYDLPLVTIEREDQYVSSINTDNYQGGVEATELLHRCGCDVYLHINIPVLGKKTPAFRRIDGFRDVCRKYDLPHEFLSYKGESSYQDLAEKIQVITDDIARKYPGKRKGIFCSNDTIANIVSNHLLRNHSRDLEEYRLIGFDGSPVSEQAVYPISTIAQQIDQLVDGAMELIVDQIRIRKKDPSALLEPVHRTVAPVLISRATTEEV